MDRCQEIVYARISDLDYQVVRVAVEEAVRRAWEFSRQDVATLDSNGCFQPRVSLRR